MKTNSNKKSIFIIFLTSMLALILSVVTLFTLPTFSASAVAGVPEDEQNVVTCRELKVGDVLKDNVTLGVHATYNDAVYLKPWITIDLESGDSNRICVQIGGDTMRTKDKDVTGVFNSEEGIRYFYINQNAIFTTNSEYEFTIDGKTISAIWGEGETGEPIEFTIYEYSLVDTSNYIESEYVAGTSLSGKFIRVKNQDLSNVGQLMLICDEGYLNYDAAAYTSNAGEYKACFVNDFGAYVDIYIPKSIDISITKKSIIKSMNS